MTDTWKWVWWERVENRSLIRSGQKCGQNLLSDAPSEPIRILHRTDPNASEQISDPKLVNFWPVSYRLGTETFTWYKETIGWFAETIDWYKETIDWYTNTDSQRPFTDTQESFIFIRWYWVRSNEYPVNFHLIKVETTAAVEYDHRISAVLLTGEGFPFRPESVFVTYTHLSVGHSVIARLGILLQDSDGVISESLTCNQSKEFASKLTIINNSSSFIHAFN